MSGKESMHRPKKISNSESAIAQSSKSKLMHYPIFSMPIYGLSASGMTMEPSFCW